MSKKISYTTVVKIKIDPRFTRRKANAQYFKDAFRRAGRWRKAPRADTKRGGICMKRNIRLFVTAVFMTVLFSMTAFGAGWATGQGENSGRW